MITVLNKNKTSEKGNSAYNLNQLNSYLARKNFINSISAVTNPVHTLTNFNTFMELIYTNNLQDNLSLWFSGEYTKRSGTIVSNLQDVDQIYFYSKDKNYSGQYLEYPTLMNNKAKFNSTDGSIRFTTTESFYYHLDLDKALPLGNSNKTIIIVMSPLNSSYEYDTTENNWFFNYGLDWTSSLQPSNEGLCFTYDNLVTNGKKFSYTIGGNNNILLAKNSSIDTKGVVSIFYNNQNKKLSKRFQSSLDEILTFSEEVSGSPKSVFTLPVTLSEILSIQVYVTGTLLNPSAYTIVDNTLTVNTPVAVGDTLVSYIVLSTGLIDINHPIDIKSGNGFFLNSHVINNSVNLTTSAFHKMKNWKFYEFMIFDKELETNKFINVYNYLATKYSLS